MGTILKAMAWLGLMLGAGCAFDISRVRQQPTMFTAATSPVSSFILHSEIKATMGTGFPTRLKAGTRWHHVGSIAQGAVFTTKDQVVMVEASNNYEAHLVVADNCLQGFYLPVESTFVAVSRPIPLETQPLNPNQP